MNLAMGFRKLSVLALGLSMSWSYAAVDPNDITYSSGGSEAFIRLDDEYNGPYSNCHQP